MPPTPHLNMYIGCLLALEGVLSEVEDTLNAKFSITRSYT